MVIGRLGSEQTELVLISSITGSTITLDAQTSFAHKKGLEVQKILFNKRIFYTATTKTGIYSPLTGGTKTIEVDRPNGTFFEDAAGTSSTWYKATYYNSTASPTVETHLDDAIPAQGGDSDHYTSIYSIRKQAGFEEAFGVSDEIISDYREEAENEFESRIVSVYPTPLTTKPKIGRQIVNLLAAGNLLIKEYGMEANIEISKSGARMIDRANALIDKILDGSLKLIGDDGSLLGTQGIFLVSGSNVYDGTTQNKGELFTLEDEIFKAADPDTGYGATH